jgi:germacradienol/geosmin synthase
MPQHIAFDVPFAAPVSPHLDSVRAAHLEWVRSHGLVRSAAGLLEYESWDLPQAAARTYPYASEDDLRMLMNWFSLAFLFDDQVDATGGGYPQRVAAVAKELIAIPFQPPGSGPDVVCPITLAWSEVWEWLSDGMSEPWRNRFASSWARFLAAHIHEVGLSGTGKVLGLEEYLVLRRITVGIHHSIDAAERSRRFEVPVEVQAHQVMRQMRDAAADAIAAMNDIHSLEREERRGDPHNLVTVLRRDRGLSRKEAVDEAVRIANDRLASYRQLEARIPVLCDDLRLAAERRAAVEMGVEGIRNWVRGNYDWALNTGRYVAAKTGAAVEAERRGQGAVDDLLPQPTIAGGGPVWPTESGHEESRHRRSGVAAGPGTDQGAVSQRPRRGWRRGR